jgi:hypothetical protein
LVGEQADRVPPFDHLIKFHGYVLLTKAFQL